MLRPDLLAGFEIEQSFLRGFEAVIALRDRPDENIALVGRIAAAPRNKAIDGAAEYARAFGQG